MPKLSLADQVDHLKAKMSGLFSRSKKTTENQTAINERAGAPSQGKRLLPLVVVVAIFGGGYTYQDDIMAMIDPAPLAAKPAPLPVAMPATAPPQMDTVAEVDREPAPALEQVPVEPLQPEFAQIDDAVDEMVNETSASEAAEMDLIERKLQAMQELEAMTTHVEETSAPELAMVMTEEASDMLPVSPTVEQVNAAAAEEVAMQPVFEATPDQSPVIHTSFPSEPSAESMQANQWTLWQSSNQWAVQLMAVQTKAYLADFIASNDLEDGATYFEFSRNGSHFYALVMGVYNTHAAAEEAAQSFSAEFGLQPWVRSMRSIQSVINYDFEAEEPTLTLSQLAPHQASAD